MHPIRVGIIGLGGFAQCHHFTVQELEKTAEARLVCTCDPAPDAFTGKAELEFEKRGVRVFNDYRTMLEQCRPDLDTVVIPTPIYLHAEMHKFCAAAGLPVYLEKPPTLDHRELDSMLAAEKSAVKNTVVGFNFIAEKQRQILKRRILDGEFGRLKSVSFIGLWPRDTNYFTRNNWAGKLFLNGRPVFDSCMGNALAHYVHNSLFWAGADGLFSWAAPLSVQAIAARAHAIESPDTFLVQADLSSGTRLRLALSHACAERAQEEMVECEKAVIRYVTGQDFSITRRDGSVETGQPDQDDLLLENHRAYYRYLRGETDRPLTRLADTKPFVHLYNLTWLAAGSIRQAPPEHTTRTSAGENLGDFVAIQDIRRLAEQFVSRGLWPHQQGTDWLGRPGQADRRDLVMFPPTG